MLDPTSAEPPFGLGRAAEARSDFETAAADYERAVALAPKSWIYTGSLFQVVCQQ